MGTRLSPGKYQIRLAASVLLGALLTWLLFRGTDWPAVQAALRRIRVPWLLAALALTSSSHLARVKRWSYVIRAIRPIRFRTVFSAAQIGFLFNVTLPLRVGDAIRAYVLDRLGRVGFSRSLALVALDRIGDTIGMLAIVFVAVLSFPTGRDIEFVPGIFQNDTTLTVSSTLIGRVAFGLTALLCGVVAVLVALYAKGPVAARFLEKCLRPLSQKAAGRLSAMMRNFISGMAVLRSAHSMAAALFFSLLAWSCGVLCLSAVLTAFRVPFPWYTPFLMQAMIAVFVIVPLTPGLVGQFHIPIVACVLLATPDTTVDEAKAIALVAHVVTLIPIVAMGVFCLVLERLNLGELAREPAQT